MSYQQYSLADEINNDYIRSAIAGLLAGVVMGVLLAIVPIPFMVTTIPAIYGLQGAVAGWTIHLFHSILFGLVYAYFVNSNERLYNNSLKTSTGIVQGMTYGVALWAVFSSVLMPFWFAIIGFVGTPGFPNFSPLTLVFHLVYGAILGYFFFPTEKQ